MKNERVNLSISDNIMEEMKREILSGKYKPGEKLPSESKLCEATGASRISVRAAIHKLAAVGLVETIKGSGTYVKKSSDANRFDALASMLMFEKPDRMHMFEFRKILEVESVALAAMRANVQQVNKMYEVSNAMMKAETPAMMAKQDMAFHYAIAEATGNPIIIKVFEILMQTYLAIMTENTMIMGNSGALYHKQIAAAIESRDVAKARQLMEEHINVTIQETAKINN